eukprot:8083357-Heterocapsa_arctica.AAC.1
MQGSRRGRGGMPGNGGAACHAFCKGIIRGPRCREDPLMRFAHQSGSSAPMMRKSQIDAK